MKKTVNWMLTAILICGASVFAACTPDTADNPAPARQRVVNFEGIENGRDMGGLVMQDGRRVRFDMLLRSANLSTATDADVEILKGRYRLTDVFDFRFDAEAAAAPDREMEGVRYLEHQASARFLTYLSIYRFEPRQRQRIIQRRAAPESHGKRMPPSFHFRPVGVAGWSGNLQVDQGDRLSP